MERVINIDKMIDEHKCPGTYWRVQATTCYEPHEAEHMCLRCWKDYCKENNYKIDYGNGIIGE